MRCGRIIGTGSYLPSRVVGNDEVSRVLSLDSAAIYRLTGIRTRRWVAGDETTSLLAEHAARRAFEGTGMSPASLDAILVSTTSPDMVFPSTACHLQRRLGAPTVAAFDVAGSCSGFLYGLSMANCMINAGLFRRCLVVAAEVKSRFLDPHDEATAILFADGAGAALVTAEEGGADSSHGLMGVRLYADGGQYRLISLPAGGSRQPTTLQTLAEHRHTIRLQGGPLFRTAVKRLSAAVQEILKEFGVGIRDVKCGIFHQANGRLLAALQRRLGLAPDQMFSVIEQFGNTSSASLPIALDHAVREGRIASGDLVLLGAFGGGLTWATALLRW